VTGVRDPRHSAIPAAWRSGVARARGDWIGVLDADPQYQPDERLVHVRARRRGLRVLFIDPESYVAPDGGTLAYPVEAPQRDDLFVRATADAAMGALCPRLGSAAGHQIA
jgi:glycosyltransferase involved in cell wall biosynthesis